MQNVAFLQQLQGEQQLLGVRADGLHVQANIVAVLFEHFAQIHAD